VALRVAAIDFLNPAPLMWDFYHPPLATALAERYDLHPTSPARCAQALLTGHADLGLIPIAALTSDLLIVPGCTIASLDRVRSIQLIVRPNLRLDQVRTVAADTASRSSVAYAKVLFRHFLGTQPDFLDAPANPEAMLAQCDAALLIGDPALLALERRAEIEAHIFPKAGPCTWHDIAQQWHTRTGLPWVAAVWAVRPEAVPTAAARQQLIDDLNTSRDHGLAHLEDLVAEWTPRIALPPATIRHYLSQNIHYHLDPRCERTIQTFRKLAFAVGALPPLATLNFLEP
jgi:chorismate dehydratase